MRTSASVLRSSGLLPYNGALIEPTPARFGELSPRAGEINERICGCDGTPDCRMMGEVVPVDKEDVGMIESASIQCVPS